MVAVAGTIAAQHFGSRISYKGPIKRRKAEDVVSNYAAFPRIAKNPPPYLF